MTPRHVLAGAIIDPSGRKLLLAQRDRPPEVAGLWELPGGKAEPGESDAAALRRELAEELGVDVSVGEALREHVSLSGDLVLVAMWARVVDGEPVALEHRAVRWVDAEELTALAAAAQMVPADTAWLPQLVATLGERSR
ncbi:MULTISPECIES: (deoxy)nucleoside triphosphate pyrophosphohydrolase [Gordonia]|jgi:8-oxo-dGTP diphosphatase|uniref:(deoxy)nucleoside triphosphate pyrophosphohydrolase n=1 Tax=Gordonia TaxID=2053 RepID=UPI0032B5F730